MSSDAHLGAGDHSSHDGFDAIAARLRAMGQLARPVLGSALYHLGEEIIGEAQEDYVPVDEGILKASGYVAPVDTRDDEVSVTMGFGGPAGDYALVQHENEFFHHTVGEYH